MTADELQTAIVGAITALGAIFGAMITVAAGVVALYAKVRPQLRALKDDSEAVRHQVEHNSGTSLKDALRRIETEVLPRIEHRQERDFLWQADVNVWRKQQDAITRRQTADIQQIKEASEETHVALAARIDAVDERTQP